MSPLQAGTKRLWDVLTYCAHTQSLIERNIKFRASLTASTFQTTDSYHTSVSLIAVCHNLFPLSHSGVGLNVQLLRKWAGERWGLPHWQCQCHVSGDSPITEHYVPMHANPLALIHIVGISTIISPQRQAILTSSGCSEINRIKPILCSRK